MRGMIRQFIGVAAVLGAFAVSVPGRVRAPAQVAERVPIVEASIADLQAAMAEKRVTAVQLVMQALHRIAMYEDRLNAVITVNPMALAEAEPRSIRSGRPARSAGRSTAFRSRSRTTSTRRTCRRPAARWRSTGWFRRTRRR